MNRRILCAAAMLAFAPGMASAQTVAPSVRAPQLRANVDALMRTLRTAVEAELTLRRARGENVAELEQELAALQASQSENVQMIKLQMAMQRENRVFTSVSNILRTRHETAKNSISNVR